MLLTVDIAYRNSFRGWYVSFSCSLEFRLWMHSEKDAQLYIEDAVEIRK